MRSHYHAIPLFMPFNLFCILQLVDLLLFSWVAVLRQVIRAFKPSAMVLQCGCDALAGDPLGKLNLTTRGAPLPTVFPLHLIFMPCPNPSHTSTP